MSNLSSRRATREFLKPQLSDFFGMPKSLPEGTLRIVNGDVLVSEEDPLLYVLTNEEIPIEQVHAHLKSLSQRLGTTNLLEVAKYSEGVVVVEHVNAPEAVATKIIIKRGSEMMEKTLIEEATPSQGGPRYDVYYGRGYGIYERDHEIIWLIEPPRDGEQGGAVVISKEGEVRYYPVTPVRGALLKIGEKEVQLRE